MLIFTFQLKFNFVLLSYITEFFKVNNEEINEDILGAIKIEEFEDAEGYEETEEDEHEHEDSSDSNDELDEEQENKMKLLIRFNESLVEEEKEDDPDWKI